MSVETETEAQGTENAQGASGAPAASSGSLTRAFREGVSDAAAAASRMAPAVGEYLSKGLYDTCYYATYGVVFGALTVGKLFPSNGTVMHGIEDGARDAKRAVESGRVIEVQTEGGAS